MTVRHDIGFSRPQRYRMCLGSESTPNKFYSELYKHACVLEKAHYGRHKCWCGWLFGEPDTNHRQPRVVEIPWDKWDAR
jgi:hypothetical protein